MLTDPGPSTHAAVDWISTSSLQTWHKYFHVKGSFQQYQLPSYKTTLFSCMLTSPSHFPSLINPWRACAARVINPQRACAARVTVVVLCVCVCPPISAASHIGITQQRYQRVHSNTAIVLNFADFPKNASFKSYGIICLPRAAPAT